MFDKKVEIYLLSLYTCKNYKLYKRQKVKINCA